MRRAIRVYAIVALVAMVVFLVGLWTSPSRYAGGETLRAWALYYVYLLQLWVLLIVPLGVLAASDAARAGRRGWLAVLIALIVLAPFAAWINTLTNTVGALLAGPCLPNADCPSGPFGAPMWVIQAGWVVAFLPVPIAALVYSLTVARSAPAPSDASPREQRTLIVSAIVGIVVMTALGYLGASDYMLPLFGPLSIANAEMALNLDILLGSLWLTLAALPVAIASMALAHAAWTRSRGWVTGWIALAVLALLTVDIGSMAGFSLIATMTGAHSSDQMPYLQLLQVISIVAPAVIMLMALVYALAVERPRPTAVALAAA
ncbi:MAG: hypothetical protein KGO05_14420 [Chloroflexota bacterium]|nr:hypothetical protein [Chloroflexota bacterium]